MFKLGITRRTSLARPKSWLGKRKHASLLLLRELVREDASDHGAYDTILRMLTLPNGTWRDTMKGRFAVLDRVVLEVLRARRAPGSQLEVLDLAASSGVTSVEWFDVLASRYSISFTATDLWRDAIAIRRRGSAVTVVLDAHGNELQYVVGPFVLPGQGRESVLYPINAALRLLCRAAFLPPARALLRDLGSLQIGDFDTATVRGHEVARLPLLSHACLDRLRRTPGFHFEISNILAPLRHDADVVRAMNILTTAHFGERDLRHAIRNCIRSVKPGGLLILGRSPSDDPNAVRATVYVKDGGRPAVAETLNGGYEHDGLLGEEVAALQGPGQEAESAPLLHPLSRQAHGY